jgi:molecular chaperone GrpE
VNESTDAKEHDTPEDAADRNASEPSPSESPTPESQNGEAGNQDVSGEKDAGEEDVGEGEAGEDGGEADRIEQLHRELEELKEERDEINEKLLRKAAEFENYRKRMSEEKRRRYNAGKIEAVKPMLDVLDDFERSLDAASDLDAESDPESAYESLKGGVEMVHRKFLDELKNLGVEPIDAEGEPFDEAYHEAMMRQPTDDAEPGTVVQEIRKGYVMGDRVVRHSRVIVAAEPDE